MQARLHNLTEMDSRSRIILQAKISKHSCEGGSYNVAEMSQIRSATSDKNHITTRNVRSSQLPLR